MKKMTFFSALIGIIMLFALNVNAGTIDGIVTNSDGTVLDDSIGTKVDGKYEFFIPLSGSSGVYGEGPDADGIGFGESSDSASAPFNNAPIMDMFFHFNIAAGQIGKSISLWTIAYFI